MYELKFTAEWGTWTGYFASKYLADYDFSGHIEIVNGTITNTERIIFPKETWGPFVFSKQFEPYDKTEWDSQIHNWFDGIRVTAQVNDDTHIRIATNEGAVEFTPVQLAAEKQIVTHVSEKYTLAVIHIEPDNPQWLYAPLLSGEKRLLGADFAGDHADFFGVKGVLLPPGGRTTVSFFLTLPEPASRFERTNVKGLVRFLLSKSPERETKVNGIARFSLFLNGREVYQNVTFSCYHDTNSQFLEEVPFSIPAEAFLDGENKLELRSFDEQMTVLVPMVRIVPEIQHHMQVTSCPKWAVVGEAFCVEVLCTEGGAKIEFDYDENLFEMSIPAAEMHFRHKMSHGKTYFIEDNEEYLWQGRHEFFFRPKKAAKNAVIGIVDVWNHVTAEAVVPEIWETIPEAIPVKTGIEMRTGNPWQYAEEIRDIKDNQLGNLVVFRDYHNRYTHFQKLWEAAASCQKYGFYTDVIGMKDQNIIAAASGDRCQCVGGHECTGIFYGGRPPRNLSHSMREAEQSSVNILRTVSDAYRVDGVPVATGDASGGSRYAYLAEFDVLRHETFVGHHMLILPNARGAARAFHKNIWGTHIATQHNVQPELDDGLRRLWLGFYLSYLFGANFAFEEDSCYLCFKYYRMINDDYLPLRKREITAGFYKYSQTHPRKGSPKVDIAVIQGRFAPPFSGISTSNNSDESEDPACSNENYPVWGMAGKNQYEWGFRQPEKGFHLLETLAPGIYLNPLNQQARKVRKFFSGDPNGEFDFLPVEADLETFSSYQLALLLNWHTMENETFQQDGHCVNDYERLLKYVAGGGVLFLSVPQLTTRTDRDFLADMEDLRLIYNGDVADLCGVRINGKSTVSYSDAIGKMEFAGIDFNAPTDSIRLPNSSADEDGECRLADITLSGAEVVISNRQGVPIVVRNKVGDGFVYLLCTYAYPGHEALKDFMPHLIQALIDCHVKRDTSVDDPSGDVYWSDWRAEAGRGKLYLLNTDWTVGENQHAVIVNAGGCRFSYEAIEGKVREICYSHHTVLYLRDTNVSLTLLSSCDGTTNYILSGFGKTELCVLADKDVTLTISGKVCSISAGCDPYSVLIDLDCMNGSAEVTVEEWKGKSLLSHE